MEQIFEKKNWFFCYHSIENDEWSLPKGFAQALRNFGINIFEFPYKVLKI